MKAASTSDEYFQWECASRGSNIFLSQKQALGDVEGTLLYDTVLYCNTELLNHFFLFIIFMFNVI